jgi:hypothetical protein
LVAFVLARWEFECKLSTNPPSSASATADVIADPAGKLGLFVGAAIHDGNPPIAPSGNSQENVFTLRELRPPFNAKALTVRWMKGVINLYDLGTMGIVFLVRAAR